MLRYRSWKILGSNKKEKGVKVSKRRELFIHTSIASLQEVFGPLKSGVMHS